jgi:hypothetical protein
VAPRSGHALHGYRPVVKSLSERATTSPPGKICHPHPHRGPFSNLLL